MEVLRNVLHTKYDRHFRVETGAPRQSEVLLGVERDAVCTLDKLLLLNGTRTTVTAAQGIISCAEQTVYSFGERRPFESDPVPAWEVPTVVSFSI